MNFLIILNYSYDENGNLKAKGGIKIQPPTPIRLEWEFCEDLLLTINESYDDAKKRIAVSFRSFIYFVLLI